MTGIITGIGWHMVGAASAASFYAPISKVKRWTWESTWAVAGIFSWVLLPICVSAILLPDMRSFYGSLDASVVLRTFLFGCMWGVGNVSYGLTMRYLGMSLGIGVAIGVTLVVGTLIPPLVHGQAARTCEHARRPAHAVGHCRRTLRHCHCVDSRASQRNRAGLGNPRIRCEEGADAGRHVRHLLLRHVVCHGCGQAHSSLGACPRG